MTIMEDFIQQSYNRDARLTVRGKWDDKEAGIRAAEEYVDTHTFDGWTFDKITSYKHPDYDWWWIEIRYRRRES